MTITFSIVRENTNVEREKARKEGEFNVKIMSSIICGC